jgi:hypothetical protein
MEDIGTGFGLTLSLAVMFASWDPVPGQGGFFSELVKNLPEIISRVKDNWLGLIALVLVLTAIVTVVIAPQTERKRIVYLILIGAILLVASAFHEAVRQQERLDKAPVVESAPKEVNPKPAAPASKAPSESSVDQPTTTTHQRWCSEDPDTKIPFSRDISFAPGEHLTGRRRGGDSNTPGSEWVIDWPAPGPVYSVSARQTGWCEQIDSCSSNGSVAHCEGWINGGNAPIIMTVKWKLPCAAETDGAKN